MKKSMAIAGAAAVAIVAVAGPASAGVYGDNIASGYLASGASCGTSTCTMVLTWPGRSNETAKPTKLAQAKFCGKWGVSDGTYIGSSGVLSMLTGKNMVVLYGGSGKPGAVNCK